MVIKETENGAGDVKTRRQVVKLGPYFMAALQHYI